MVFRSYELKKNLLWKEVPRETKIWFIQGIRELQTKWWRINAIVSDGKRWVLWAFPNIPSQMCHFHQKQIVTRYITSNPILLENIELKEIVECLWKFSKKWFTMLLEDWYRRNKTFLEERNESWKLVHWRTKSAYNSLKNNLKYLYTYEDYRGIIDIPRTTNSLESTFSRLKAYLWVHRWQKKWRKLKSIDYILSK